MNRTVSCSHAGAAATVAAAALALDLGLWSVGGGVASAHAMRPNVDAFCDSAFINRVPAAVGADSAADSGAALLEALGLGPTDGGDAVPTGGAGGAANSAVGGERTDWGGGLGGT
jgi:hypothetical protein